MTTDALRPPEGVTAKALAQAARKVERLKLRRRALIKKVNELDAELRQASRFLRDLAREASTVPTEAPSGPIEGDGVDAASTLSRDGS